MGCKALISDADHFLVKRALVRAFFIAADEYNGLPLGVEGKSETPNPVISIEP
jgi:hypothetical protein